ncbi:MAG: pseudaminic acid cytidylyltransferase [Magnetococcales bacterium]|nr:pseudaminic acid cytidylyltransferase [Magnetococcales bacterium]
MSIAIIPARGGSKRIPGKNIKLFLGKPLIHYSIAAALQSGLFTRVVVSTDSEEIARVAEEAGAEIPFLRPATLADDFVTSIDVAQHAIQTLGGSERYARFCFIYATAPFIQPQALAQGAQLQQQHQCSSVFTVSSFASPIHRALKLEENGCLRMFWPEHERTRSNDLPEAYFDAGQFYWLETARFLKQPAFFSADARPLLLPRYLVQDIDTPEDWENAEFLFQALQLRGLLS